MKILPEDNASNLYLFQGCVKVKGSKMEWWDGFLLPVQDTSTENSCTQTKPGQTDF